MSKTATMKFVSPNAKCEIYVLFSFAESVIVLYLSISVNLGYF